ncbi:hypothetical protein EYC80_007282 [Monilinia laxa]|uniref:Uncharacterized protein n=1 Tax=Monilinia laxa TaxID=61186 RepID=A0A5N6JU74_MONLA|nr:hypothetical protein EYC80_007282 [Monilinia laxa]
MAIENPTTTTDITAEYPSSSPLTFITHTPEQEGLVTPPYISPTNMALILLWAALIIMLAILWYHVTFSVSGVATRWNPREYQYRVPTGEEASLLQVARSLEEAALLQVQDLPEERAPDSDAGSTWANESEDEEVDTNTNCNTNQGGNRNASPSTKSEVAGPFNGSLDPVPDRRIIEDGVDITTTEQDNINIRRLEEYNDVERWRLNIGILDEAERERVHWYAEWMRTQAHWGLAHSPSDFWYR